ncbi:MAG: S8 family serine peptidase, partial [Thermoguttaceae bacterium]
DAGPLDWFGSSVAIDGDVAIVGAPDDDGPGIFDSDFGSAYIFRFDGNAWVQEQRLVAADAGYEHHFGNAVAISGDTALIGANYDDQSGTLSGAAYIFHFDGNQWVQQQKLMAANAERSDFLGHSVSLSGEMAVLGAVGDDDGGTNAGSALVFRFDGQQWIETQTLIADDADRGESFGESVAIDGTTLIVGARSEDHAGPYSGAAYAFHFDGDQWTQQQKLTASDADRYDSFGQTVAVSGQIAVVGAYGNSDAGPSSGSAYVYEFDGTQWTEQQKLLAGDANASDRFGTTVAIGGRRVIVGADGHDAGSSNAGAIYAFSLIPADDFAINVGAGDPLVISTATPGDDPAEPVNLLDPILELFDPDGQLVATDDDSAADDRNARLTHTATTSGTYRIRVLGANQSEGDYVLTVGGNTGGLSEFRVEATDPTDGDLVPFVTDRVSVDFDRPVLLTTLDPEDLLIDGIPAVAVVAVDADTVSFLLPTMAEGPHTMVLAAGAVVDLQGLPVERFESRFVIDLPPPRVVESSVVEDNLVPLGAFLYTARFDRPLQASVLDSADVRLRGVLSGTYEPLALAYDPATMTLSLQYEGLIDDLYTLTLLSGDGQFEDTDGRHLDGEPRETTTVPSGDGVPGGHFTVRFAADATAMPAAMSFGSVAPAGSLVARRSIAGAIGAADQTDLFPIDLGSGQTVTVVVEPDAGLLLSIDLIDPDGVILGSATAAAAGQDVVLQTARTTTSGSYRLVLGDAGSTGATGVSPVQTGEHGQDARGTYRLEVILNAAVEEESYDGTPNDEAAAAQDLDASSIELGLGATDRLAAIGRIVSSEDWYRFTLDDRQPATLALKTLTPGGRVTLDLFDSTGNHLARGVASAALDQVIGDFTDASDDAAPDAYFARVIGSPHTDYSLVVTRGAGFDVEPNDDLDAAQPLGRSGTVLGHLAAPYVPTGQAKGPAREPIVAGVARLRVSNEDARILANPATTRRLIVRYHDSSTTMAKSAAVGAIGAVGGTVVRQLPLIDGVLVELPDTKADLRAVAAMLSADPSILYAQPDYVLDAFDTFPSDPSFSDLWGLHNTGQTGGIADADIDAPAAWDIATGRSEVVVAVLDTGVDYTHEDLAANMWVNPGETAGDGIDNDGNGYIDDVYGIDTAYGDSDPMDGYFHGTHVAGTIGAVGNNGIGIAGVNWNVRIMALKFLSDRGSGTTSDAIEGLQYMTRMKTDYGVNIVAVNASFGGEDFSPALRDAIEAANDAGIMLIASAGNDGNNIDPGDADAVPTYPAAFDLEGILSVAATDHDDRPTWFSNYGSTSVDLAAPGADVLSTMPGNNYATYSGTSMAAPHVTGAVALVVAYNPDATLAEVKSAILRSVDPVAALEAITVAGGRLNLAGALLNLGDPGDYYRVDVTAGDTLLIETGTPGDGPFPTQNRLDPVVEFYDPGGLLVAADDNGGSDGRNARLTYEAILGGSYTVRVLSAAESGEYVLHVEGHSGDPAPLLVDHSDPGDGAALDEAPETMTVTFSDAILLTSLEAGDLTVDGLPAVGIQEILDGRTVVFELPDLAEGPHWAAMAGGSVLGINGMPVERFGVGFVVDLTSPQVVASTLAEGDVVPAGTLRYAARFDEPLRQPDLAGSAVRLVGLLSGSHTPELFHYEPITSTLSLDFTDLPDDTYTLTLLSGDGRFEDVAGNDLGGGHFVVNFIADADRIDAQPFERLEPLGGLMYLSGENAAVIYSASDSDRFTFSVEGGQTITAVVTPRDPTAVMQIELPGLSGPITSPAPGESVVLPPTLLPDDGTYEIRIAADRLTAYDVQFGRNLAMETEGNVLAIDDSLIDLGAQRYGLLGTSGPNDVDEYTLDLTGMTGRTIDVVLAGQGPHSTNRVDFSTQTLVLLDTDGVTVLATAAVDPLGPTAGNFDLAILDFTVPADGVYTLQFSSSVEGAYGIVVTVGSVFESEPNNGPGDPHRRLDAAGSTALGHLGVSTPLLFAAEWESWTKHIIHTIDPQSGDVLGSFPAPIVAPSHEAWLNLAFDGERLYYGTGQFGNEIYVLDARDATVLDHFTAAESESVVGLACLGRELFVMDEAADQIDVYNLRSFEYLRSFSTAETLTGLSGSETEGVLYGVDYFTKQLVRIDPTSGAVLDRGPLGTQYSWGTAVVGDEIFVAESGGYGSPWQEIVVYDVGTYAELRRFTLPFDTAIGGLGGDGVPAQFIPEGSGLTGSGESDWYELDLVAGDAVIVSTQTPLDNPNGSPSNDLDPALSLLDPDGQTVASDSDSAEDGKNARITFVAQRTGTYRIGVTAEAGRGEYVLHVAEAAEVVGRAVFYNDSAWDGNDAAANEADDMAVATDKRALLPGETATFANYTSYAAGINGIMVDVRGLADATNLSPANDFRFKAGNTNDPSSWTDAPMPTNLDVRTAAGTGGSDRITLVWPDHAIEQQWLQVTVLATAHTGLVQNDVFYFGNAPGEAGDQTINTIVNATDEIVARNFSHGPLSPAGVDDPYDYNRDKLVNASDRIIARTHQTNPLTMLRLITAPSNDASDEQAGEQVAIGPTLFDGSNDWLYEVERTGAKRRASQQKSRVEEAVEMLLASDWS